jgi:hypothetical protein
MALSMGIKDTLEQEKKALQDKYFGTSILMDQIWTYHPQNPNFVNPISFYEKLKGELEELDRRINSLELKINSLN